ncbi:MAG: ATP synthase F1 subunit delta [Holosporaceae bacterium]|jgi:F-type H+-transporting ATPase subunit delta|nr:ATP synthase F1 subunit delta [Holosporaceae bacterium]
MADCELKAENSIVSRYVKALYEVSASSGTYKKILKEFELIRDCVLAIDGFEKHLKRTSLIAKFGENFIAQLKEILNLSQQMENFLLLLLKNKRLSLLLEICDGYSSLVDDVRGKKVFFVTHANGFSKEDKQQLISNLCAVFHGKIECVVKKDPSLIGGIKIQFRSKILDYSVKSRLERLYRAIKGDIYEN